MGRLDWKRGRFDTDFETTEIHQGLRGHQGAVGDEIQYFRFDSLSSEMDDIYDEGDGVGRVYRPPVTVPVLHVTHDEGENQDTDVGFYFSDNIYVTASFDQLFRTGLTLLDIEHDTYLKDRLTYDGRVFRVTQIHILGQIQQRDIVVSIEGTQVKPDEMVNDPQFSDLGLPYISTEPPPVVPAPATGGPQVLTQSSPSANWILPHTLGREPHSVMVLIGDFVVDADVEVSETQIVVTHATPETGRVHVM